MVSYTMLSYDICYGIISHWYGISDCDGDNGNGGGNGNGGDGDRHGDDDDDGGGDNNSNNCFLNTVLFH